MQEKDMVLDVLNTTKASLGLYQTAITECNNEQLRTTFQQMRNGDEKFQYDLYKVANNLGYYKTPKVADQNEVSTAKTTLQSTVQTNMM